MKIIPERKSGAPAPRGRSPAFWKELVSFATVCLGAYIVALLVLPPRWTRYQRLRQLEHELVEICDELEGEERRYEAAIIAVENDPFYREEVYRRVLGVKKRNEEFLRKPLKASSKRSDKKEAERSAPEPQPEPEPGAVVSDDR